MAELIVNDGKMTSVEKRGMILRDKAQTLVVNDQYSYDVAAEFLTNVKTSIKAVEEAMDPQCKAAYNAWQTANKQKKTYLKPYEEAEVIVKGHIASYHEEQKRLIEEQGRAIREDAERQEEEERAALLSEAEALEAGGHMDAAAELRMQADMVFVPVVVGDHSVAKTEGISTSSKVHVEICDIKKFLHWLLTGTMDIDSIVTVKTAPIEQYIKLTKTTTIPGVKISNKTTVSVRSKR